MSKPKLYLAASNPAAAPVMQPEPEATESAREEISKEVIAKLARQPKSGKDIYISDAEIAGFKLRRTKQGTIVFIFHGRIKGFRDKTYKRTIGRAHGVGAIALNKARTEATQLRDDCAKGIDPGDELRQREEEAEAAQLRLEQQAEQAKLTPTRALKEMLDWHANHKDPAMRFRPETEEQYTRGIGYLGKLASKPIVSIKPQAIRDALGEVGGVAKPVKAKRALSAVITHAIKHLELNIINPVSLLERGEFKGPEPRESYIREDDVGGFIHKIESIATTGRERAAERRATVRPKDTDATRSRRERGAVRLEREAMRAKDFALLTLLYGTRKEEMMKLQWSWFNWDDGVITLPASLTKQKRKHYLPLTEWTRAILEPRYAARAPDAVYVFPGNKAGKPVSSIRCSLAGAVGDEFMLHDARRTLITHCESLGITGSRLKAIVGHTRKDVTESYNQREIAQVRRDLERYHGWLREQHYNYGFDLAFPNAREEAAAANPKQSKVERWPGC